MVIWTSLSPFLTHSPFHLFIHSLTLFFIRYSIYVLLLFLFRSKQLLFLRTQVNNIYSVLRRWRQLHTHTHTHWLRMLKHIHIQTHFHFIKLMNFMQHDQLKWNIVIKESIVAKEGERTGERAMCVLNLLIIVFLFVILSFGFQSVPCTLTRSFFPIFCVTLKNNWSLEFNQINRFSPFLKFQPNKEPRNRALIQTVCRSNGCLCAMYMSKQHTLAWGRCCWFFVHFGQSICEGRQHIYYWHTVFSCAFFVHDFTWHIYCLF